MAVTLVVPEPRKGSSTVSPGEELARISFASSFSGFCVGWAVFSAIDQNGTVDIPVEAEDGGSITSPLDKRLRFVVWQDYAGENGGKSTFGVYDAANRVFFGLPSLLRKNVLLRPFANGSGWQLCNLTDTVTYCELRMVEANDADNEEFTRIANVGSQQLQARVLTSYAGLTEEYIQKHTVLLGAE